MDRVRNKLKTKTKTERISRFHIRFEGKSITSLVSNVFVYLWLVTFLLTNFSVCLVHSIRIDDQLENSHENYQILHENIDTVPRNRRNRFDEVASSGSSSYTSRLTGVRSSSSSRLLDKPAEDYYAAAIGKRQLKPAAATTTTGDEGSINQKAAHGQEHGINDRNSRGDSGDSATIRFSSPAVSDTQKAYAQITGPTDLYLYTGQTLRLRCRVINKKETSERILWYRNDRLINGDTDVRISNGSLVSEITILNILPKHAGNYTCVPNKSTPDFVTLHILIDTKPSTCSASYFTCADGTCIPLGWKCDSKVDCTDGSDEPSECATATKCNEGQFSCKETNKCIPHNWVCDGENDCDEFDHSDEANCTTSSKCLYYESECDNGYCLENSKFCNGHWDCDSDERHCENTKKLCQDLNCSSGCKLTSKGPKCLCPLGLEAKGSACVDFDECTIEGVCDQICNNTQGSYECTCVSGYKKDGKKCHGVNVPPSENASLVYFTTNNIEVVAVSNGERNTFQQQHITTIEIWHRNRTVCSIYNNETHPLFRCHKIDNLSEQWELQLPEIAVGMSSIDQIRLDWIAGNWYFLNTEYEIIFMCNNILTFCTIILENSLNNPSSLALDPTKGYLFYTELSANLKRSGLDGSNQTVIVSNKIYYPFGVTLDLANEHVYWVDTYIDFVERVDYNGKNRWSLKKSLDTHHIVKSLLSVEVFEDQIYLTSRSNHSIISIDRSLRQPKLLISNVDRADGLRVFHRQKQPDVPHPCRDRNGLCDQICVTAWKKFTAVAQCICSPGYRLKTPKQCARVEHGAFLVYTALRPFRIKGISMSNKSLPEVGSSSVNQETIVPIYNLQWPLAFDFNVKEQLIYFVQNDVTTKEFRISKQKLNGSERKEFYTGTETVTGLAYDWILDHLFYVAGKKIVVFGMKNVTLIRTILPSLNSNPMSMVIDPQQGVIYWTSWISTEAKEGGAVESAWMDGSNKKILTDSSKFPITWPLSLTIDYLEKKLYWCDAKEHSVERMSLDGSDREILFKDSSYTPHSITYHNQYIFWSDNVKGNVFRIHVGSSSSVLKAKSEILTLEKEAVPSIKVFDSISQSGSNKCVSTDCPGICLYTPAGPLCKCPDGYSLNANGATCIAHVNYDVAVNCTRGTTPGFLCRNTAHCIDMKNVCDGFNECNDGSDEDFSQNGVCNAGNCNLTTNFICDKVKCLQRNVMCSGIKHCIDGTDQMNCPTMTCNSNEFTCKKSGRCIPNAWVSDGEKDCGNDDYSDELPSAYLLCSEFECLNGNCIPFFNVCDGETQCGDSSDEIGCESQCGTNESYCAPMGCYGHENVCDGIRDCEDGSDEANCSSIIESDNRQEPILIACESHQFACGTTLECISKHLVCDGVVDCLDSSDEKNCSTITPRRPSNETTECNHPERLCHVTNLCIKVDQLCDGQTDCPDGTDEGFDCFKKVCDHNTECSHFCHNAPEGFVCSCPLHMFLDQSRLSCSMQHSCEHWDTCSQICEKSGKTYQCKCYEGYSLEYDQFTCKSNNLDSPYVIFSTRQEIRGVDLKTSAVKNFYASLHNTIAVDFLYLNSSVQIFWTDVIDDKIYRGILVGEALSNVEAVVQSGLSTAEGIAIDWIGMNLYWIDSNLDQIEVALVNGSFRRTLVAGDMESPRALALDPLEGLLFWSDWEENYPRIERCTMSGEKRQTIVQVTQIQNGGWPNGLTLDYIQKRVYWVDARSDSIYTTEYDGSHMHMVIHDREYLSHPFAISIFENYVYWTDWRTNSVIRANKWNGTDIQIIQRILTQPFGIQVLHSSRQRRDGTNPCENNAGCSHLCLLSSRKTYKCACPHVMRLDTDEKTCVPNEQVLLFIMGSEIRGIDLMQPNHYAIPTISHSPQVVAPQRIDFTVEDSRLYWSDTQLNEVNTAGLSNGLIKTILNTDIQKPFGFAVDWIAKNMYVSSGKSRCKILASNLQGEYVTEILNDLNIVESIALDPANGKMYYSHSNEKQSENQIEMTNLDGSSRTILCNCSKAAQSLALDFDSKRIYFVYYNYGVISYIDLVNMKLHEVLSSSNIMSISSVTVYNNTLYFSENVHSAIMSCEKNACSNYTVLRKNTNSVNAVKMLYLGSQIGTNNCANERGGCQHLCFATAADRHVCKCAIGFDPDPLDLASCKGREEFVLYSIVHELKGLPLYELGTPSQSLENPEVLGPLSRISFASNIDYYAKEEYIYWADSEKGLITRIKRDGTERQEILRHLDQLDGINVDWLGGIAVDWVAGNIYWSDQKRNIIEVSRLNGAHRYVVISNVEKPTALAVDPVAGFLFYVERGTIGRTGLDGSQSFVLVNQTASVSNIALDISEQVVYWCESSTDTIMRVDYDGNQKTVMLNHSLDNPVALAIIDDRIYWADNTHQKGSIKVAPKQNLSSYTVIGRSEDNQLQDLKIFSNRIQAGTNICANENGKCQELCLFNGTHAVCACSHGKIASDTKTCEEDNKFLIYSKWTSIESIHLTDHLNMNEPIDRIQNMSFMRNTIGLSFDYETSRLFYSDIHLSSINWVYFNGSNHTILVNKQVTVEGLSYDSLHKTLFWTSNNEASIRSFDMSKMTANSDNNTALVKQIIKLNSDDKPRGIAVEPCLAMVYWTNWNDHAASIQRAYISGFGLESIIKTDIRMPNALAIDYDERKLYWADARLDKIERADYDGTHRVVLAHSTPKHPFAMAVYGDLLFWTDWVLRAVIRANKYSGADVIFLRKDIVRPMAIVAVQNITHNCDENECNVLNGGCEDVCVLDKDKKVKCQCTHGIIAPDGRRCLIESNSKCPAEFFFCNSGECIPYQLTCDNVPHCLDESDEKISFCSTRECPTDFFMCNNHRCIPINQTCDGVQNCGDGSDESSSCNCGSGKFQCASGECIKSFLKCDNDPDCTDASDEMNCPYRECSLGESLFFHCANTTACYMESWRCDGENDCWDHSDEMNCSNITKIDCAPGQFRCANGHCINEKWRCDSEDDCLDSVGVGKRSSDEMNCDNIHCQQTEFNCDNTCIPSTWQCDGTPDCKDSSDEGSQCGVRECGLHMFKCNSTGRCIPDRWVCDGEVDCTMEAEDEQQDCSVSVKHLDSCPPPLFWCATGECIERNLVCDGDADCTHGEDEYEDCESSPWAHVACKPDEFTCTNRECVSKNVTCDLKNDCGDNSDEELEMCKNSTKICAGPEFFRCGAGACVRASQLCDGSNDCSDYSDEQACNINECELANICQHKCEDRVVGYECSCRSGYKVHHLDRHLCEDVDECVEQRPCSQICQNTHGSYHCSCIEGFEKKDKHVCKATSNETAKLIFSNRYYIRQVNLSGNGSILLHQLLNAVALDFDWLTQCLYWSDVTQTISTIKQYCIRENSTKVLHGAMLKNPDGLAVDWVARNLYWCDKGYDTIEVSRLDGKYRKVLIDKNLREPRAIALDPHNRHIFWSDWGDRPYIGKAGMDGSDPKEIIKDNLGWPNALTISFETNELFWGDAREDFIAVSDLDGHNQRIILGRSTNPTLNLHHIFALAVWEDKVYWSDWETKSIEYCNKNDGKNCSTLITTIHRPMDIRVYHPYRQTVKFRNPCEDAGCSTLCLLAPTTSLYKCACPDNFYLDTDKKACVANCTAAHFQCSSTYKCIPFYWKCDTQDDCGDGSDEPEICPTFVCDPGEFQCMNKKCVNPSVICDGKDQCGDRSDEVDCNEFTCFHNHFKCGASMNSSAFCVDASKQCDKVKDCPNGEDEEDCKPTSCQTSQFMCDTGKCIPLVWVCDGDNDCKEGSDERGCEERSCSAKEFQCKSGRCIPMSWRCDGEEDCPDAEDEPPSCQSAVDHTCEPTYYKCPSSKCIPGRWRCDYENDCGDNSDELNCTMRNCSESEFRCETGKCIKSDYHCDGEVHCDDGSDELNCNITCHEDEFKCANYSTCINKKYQCDGDDDCPDGSDEASCTCPSDNFVCGNGKCIMNRWRCDGWSDCSDGSDESIELCSHMQCHAYAYKCPNHKCIRLSALCDGINDCGDVDNSDESQTVCAALPKCRHDQFQCDNNFCISKRLRCDGQYNCDDGSDELNCQPPVCSFGTCSQICIEKKAGHFNCKCAHGYQKGNNKNDTCSATGPEQILLLASEQEFRFILPEKHEGTAVMGFVETGSLKIDVFDVLITPREILLFWIDSHHNKVHTMKMDTLADVIDDQSRVKRNVENMKDSVFDIPNVDDPKSLAVDWITSKLYIISHNKIVAVDIERKKYVSLVSTEMHPTDIVLDPESRIMIWSTLENGILVASMDGSNKKSLVESDVGWPISLSIDYPTGRLYWADYRKGTIETCLLTGKDQHVVWKFENNEKPQKIDVFEDFLYIKLYDQSIIKMNKFGNDNGTYLLKGYRSSDIAIIHPLKQNKNFSNPCANKPCHEQNALCVLSSEPQGYICSCPSDLIMTQANGKSECKEYGDLPEYCPLKCSTGHCMIIDHVPRCVCPPQYEGDMCEHYRCSGYCMNKGLCQIGNISGDANTQEIPPLKCKCPSDWAGPRCEIFIPDCNSRCHNGATCLVDDTGNQSCLCAKGFVGNKCEHCENVTCKNGGICREAVSGQRQCDCHDGYFGRYCERSECDGFCYNNGDCIVEISGPKCRCKQGYGGKRCETDLCESHCLNNGNCSYVHDGLVCTCSERYDGKRCEIDLCHIIHPPKLCDSVSTPTSEPCVNVQCLNGGVCRVIQNKGICACPEEWNGDFCEKKVGYENACTDFCANGGICQLDEFQKSHCVCVGEWSGIECTDPPPCVDQCGVCKEDNSINECLCDDGQVRACSYKSLNRLSEEQQKTANVLTILAVLLSVVILLISLFGGAIFYLKKRRMGQPFLHARLTDNVEITNPMYLGDLDETPPFVHEDDKGNFANPVYESMYAGGPQDTIAVNANTTAPDERKGLLQHSHEDTIAQEIL